MRGSLPRTRISQPDDESRRQRNRCNHIEEGGRDEKRGGRAGHTVEGTGKERGTTRRPVKGSPLQCSGLPSSAAVALSQCRRWSLTPLHCFFFLSLPIQPAHPPSAMVSMRSRRPSVDASVPPVQAIGGAKVRSTPISSLLLRRCSAHPAVCATIDSDLSRTHAPVSVPASVCTSNRHQTITLVGGVALLVRHAAAQPQRSDRLECHCSCATQRTHSLLFMHSHAVICRSTTSPGRAWSSFRRCTKRPAG